MTDKTDLIREIHEYVTTHGGENTATHLLVQAASAIQTQAAELEAVGAGGVQALSAAPAAFLQSVIALCSNRGYSPANIEAWDKNDKWIADLWRQAEAMLAALPTPPAEQQATKETSGGLHMWRDISTAPKDGSLFVATGHNYGLSSEVRHTCVAKWFRGCWMEASDWNENSELKYLTHWMPLPSPPDDVAAPAEQQAQPGAVGRTGCTAGTDEECTRRGCATSCPAQQAVPKAAPGEPVKQTVREQIAAEVATQPAAQVELLARYLCERDQINPDQMLDDNPVRLAWHREDLNAARLLAKLAELAPRQEAQEPAAYVHVPHYTVEGKVRPVVSFEKYQQDYADGIYSTRIPLYTAPQPAPHLPERDASLPAERQGLFRKFVVGRVDGSDKPGGKHHGCTYFVLDVDHDPCARPALAAYAAACESTHPTLAADLRTKWGVVPAPQPSPAPLSDDAKDAARWRMAALIGKELMLRPDKRTHATAVKAYMDATHSGSDLTGAVDAAIAAQGGKA